MINLKCRKNASSLVFALAVGIGSNVQAQSTEPPQDSTHSKIEEGLSEPSPNPDTLIATALAALEVQDFEAASTGFAQAFKGGNADGAFYLGRMVELGHGSAPDMKAAIALYLAGSANKSAPAMNRLGVLHVQGQGVLQDYERGAQLVCESAQLGDPNGAFNCGTLLLEGKGTPQDEVAAYEMFKIASGQGHLGAKNEYANGLLAGKYLAQDVDGAVQLFQQTASEGNPVGLYALGQAFAAGLSVEQDIVKAHSYFNIAAALDHPLAAEARSGIELAMSTEEITSAQKLAKAWRPQTPQ